MWVCAQVILKKGFQSAPNNQFQKAPQFNPNQFQSSDPIEDLSQGVHGLANSGRATAVIVERGGGAGVDILTQFGQLFGKLMECKPMKTASHLNILENC